MSDIIDPVQQHSGEKRASFNLSDDAMRIVQEIAKRRGLSVGEVIAKALLTEKYMTEQVDAGGKILVQRHDKSYREVIFR